MSEQKLDLKAMGCTCGASEHFKAGAGHHENCPLYAAAPPHPTWVKDAQSENQRADLLLCPVCEGTGQIGIPGGPCYFCKGDGNFGLVKPLDLRIVGAQVASCDCLTKTPDFRHHSQHCRYRVLSEAQEAISELCAAAGAVLVKADERSEPGQQMSYVCPWAELTALREVVNRYAIPCSPDSATGDVCSK